MEIGRSLRFYSYYYPVFVGGRLFEDDGVDVDAGSYFVAGGSCFLTFVLSGSEELNQFIVYSYVYMCYVFFGVIELEKVVFVVFSEDVVGEGLVFF